MFQPDGDTRPAFRTHKLEFIEQFQTSEKAVIPSKRSASRDLFGSKSEIPPLKAKRSFDFAAKWLLRSG